jgi:hypothetical protein
MTILYLNKGLEQLSLSCKNDISLVLYRFPKDNNFSLQDKKDYKMIIMKNLNEHNLKIACISIINSGYELGAIDFNSRYEEWANVLGWKIPKREYFDSLGHQNNEVAITFKGLGALDDKFIIDFGKAISKDFIKFRRNAPIDNINNSNVKLFFSKMPIYLYIKSDRCFRINNLMIKYFISFNVSCTVCSLKGHKENCCPFQDISMNDMNKTLVFIYQTNEIYVNISSKEAIDMKILDEHKDTKSINDITTLKTFIRARQERRKLQSISSKQKTFNKRSANPSTTIKLTTKKES